MSAALMLMLTLAGCGGSGATSKSSSTPASAAQTTSAATSTQTSGNAQTSKAEHYPKVILRVSSPVFSGESEIPVRYTCDGADTSPPLKWGVIPRGTAELALFVLGNNAESARKQRIYWAVTGLRPTLKGVSTGRLPRGAIVGRNSLGQSRYTICPAKSDGLRHYAVGLLALPRAVSATPGFNASAFFKKVLHTAEYSGLAVFTYKRR
ncbi:MAG TPA: hypothetical protein VNY27_01735 [Solirubrobacteraceae bacterium]|nr:hypothetical protein [Solirubrobacteraceae bacterium]